MQTSAQGPVLIIAGADADRAIASTAKACRRADLGVPTSSGHGHGHERSQAGSLGVAENRLADPACLGRARSITPHVGRGPRSLPGHQLGHRAPLSTHRYITGAIVAEVALLFKLKSEPFWRRAARPQVKGL